LHPPFCILLFPTIEEPHPKGPACLSQAGIALAMRVHGMKEGTRDSREDTLSPALKKGEGTFQPSEPPLLRIEGIERLRSTVRDVWP
jgi:hypothetical protein